MKLYKRVYNKRVYISFLLGMLDSENIVKSSVYNSLIRENGGVSGVSELYFRHGLQNFNIAIFRSIDMGIFVDL